MGKIVQMEQQIFGQVLPLGEEPDVVRPEDGQGVEPLPDRHSDLHVVGMVRPGADHAEKKLVDLSTGVEGTRIVLRGKADAAVGGDIIIAAEAGVGLCLGERGQKPFQHVGVGVVIRVKEGDKIADCMVQPGVAGCTEAAVGLVDDPDARVLPGIGVAAGGAAVGGAIVDEKDIKVPVGLPQQGRHAAVQIGQNVVGRDDHADAGHSDHLAFGNLCADFFAGMVIGEPGAERLLCVGAEPGGKGRVCGQPVHRLVQSRFLLGHHKAGDAIDFAQRFSDKKREKNVLDFSDMEHFALEILLKKEGDICTPSQAARELSEKYDEVLLDEYQDSNLVQEILMQNVSGWVNDRKNIFMVGDVKQSIYRFRLARPELFMEKYKSYSLTDSLEQRIDLHKNFRSRQEVLESVNFIFRQIMGADLGGIDYDEAAALYPGASFPEGQDAEFVKTEVLLVEKDGEILEDADVDAPENERELEALAIAGKIRSMVGHDQVLDKETGEYRPVRYGDIVILLRSAAGWAETFGEVLAARGIPSYTASRTGYFSTTEVVTLLNYLRVLDHHLQDIPLTGVLRSPIVGCTTEHLEELLMREG